MRVSRAAETINQDRAHYLVLDGRDVVDTDGDVVGTEPGAAPGDRSAACTRTRTRTVARALDSVAAVTIELSAEKIAAIDRAEFSQ